MSTDEVNCGQLRAFVERIERLNEDKAALSEDIKEVYAEAKGNGFDTATIRDIVKLRKLDPDRRAERETLLDVYMRALGMYADTPLGQAAIENATKPPKKRALKSDVEAALDKGLRKAFGDPAPLTAEEKRKGAQAAFVGRDGTRVTLETKVPVGSA